MHGIFNSKSSVSACADFHRKFGANQPANLCTSNLLPSRGGGGGGGWWKKGDIMSSMSMLKLSETILQGSGEL